MLPHKIVMRMEEGIEDEHPGVCWHMGGAQCGWELFHVTGTQRKASEYDEVAKWNCWETESRTDGWITTKQVRVGLAHIS
jgi:hypothetical protein